MKGSKSSERPLVIAPAALLFPCPTSVVRGARAARGDPCATCGATSTCGRSLRSEGGRSKGEARSN